MSQTDDPHRPLLERLERDGSKLSSDAAGSIRDLLRQVEAVQSRIQNQRAEIRRLAGGTHLGALVEIIGNCEQVALARGDSALFDCMDRERPYQSLGLHAWLKGGAPS